MLFTKALLPVPGTKNVVYVLAFPHLYGLDEYQHISKNSHCDTKPYGKGASFVLMAYPYREEVRLCSCVAPHSPGCSQETFDCGCPRASVRKWSGVLQDGLHGYSLADAGTFGSRDATIKHLMKLADAYVAFNTGGHRTYNDMVDSVLSTLPTINMET